MSYKILCIDGGGIRGVFAIEILRLLQNDLGKNFIDGFDCFSGTSTGALIVAALMKGYTPADLLRFYTIFSRKIFPKKRQGVQHEAKYSHRFLHTVLQTTLLEKTTLADLKKHVIIPACRLKGKWDAEIYDNFDKRKGKGWRLIDVALRSSAAPMYFPSYQNYVDGGVYALNPSLIALTRAIDSKGGNQKLSDVQILSIGTGMTPVSIEGEVHWGSDQWMSPYQSMLKYPLVSLMTEIGATVPEYPLKQLLGKNYLRINGVLPEPVEMDDPSKVAVLKGAAIALKEDNPREWDRYLQWIKGNTNRGK